MAKVSPFEYWKVVNGQSRLTDDLQDNFEKDYDIFMMNKIISFDPQLLLFCSKIPRFMHLPKKVHFETLCEFYKSKYGRKSIYIGYSNKDKVSDDVKAVSDYYNISHTDAANYLTMISDDDLSMIRTKSKDEESYLNENLKKKTTKKGTKKK